MNTILLPVLKSYGFKDVFEINENNVLGEFRVNPELIDFEELEKLHYNVLQKYKITFEKIINKNLFKQSCCTEGVEQIKFEVSFIRKTMKIYTVNC